MSLNEKQCTLLLTYESPIASQLVKESDFQEKLESKDDSIKIEALKALICGLLNGEQYPKLLMSVIKYCLHSENHLVKKLLLLYWEVVEKRGKDGHMLHEMILVCNAIKNNLTHPNEYIRGSTLRFLCKIKEMEILESLVPSITGNLEHRHSYVRKNAVLTVFHVYEAFPELIPDAPELIESFLYSETNANAKRNAFMMLYHCDQERAVHFLNTVLQTIGSLGDTFQLVVLELIRKVCRTNPTAKSQYIRCIFNLVNSTTHAVSFEAANTLVALSSAPTAVRAAVTAYCNLLQNESDSNVKLIILGRLQMLRRRNEKILQEMLMDIMRALSSPNLDIRRKTLELTLELISNRNVEEVVQLLKKELVKCEQPEYGKNDAYRKLLMDTMHQCAVAFPDVVQTVVLLLMNYLGDENPAAAADVIFFVREIVQEYPQLRNNILSKVLENFTDIRASEVYRVAIWILGEYSSDKDTLHLALTTLREAVGPLPLLQNKSALANLSEEEKKAAEEQAARAAAAAAATVAAKKPVVLADGTYASSSAATAALDPALSVATRGGVANLRLCLLNGDYLLGAVLANAYAKLSLRYSSIVGFGSVESNEEIAKALLYMSSLLKLGTSSVAPRQMDPDCLQRITLTLKALLEPQTLAHELWTLDQPQQVFAALLEDMRKKNKEFAASSAASTHLTSGFHSHPPLTAMDKAAKRKKELEYLNKQADDLIVIRQLKARAGGSDDDLLDDDNFDDNLDLSKAIGSAAKGSGLATSKDISAKLNRVYQLTGFSDPVYVEAHLSVQDYDIVLDILLVNQTSTILQNLVVEIHTSGDLKVMEKPQSYSLGPNATHKLRATIKLTSTESGVIFGNVVYDNAAGTNKTIVVLNSIHMDVMDYIAPALCSDVAFRSMWAEFEWENKVAVNTDIADLNEYLEHILRITNMKCLTPSHTLSGGANFLAANLYARSMFQEDALLNLSVEKQSKNNGKVVGYIRIRSKTQGIALSLGDKIQAKQRSTKA